MAVKCCTFPAPASDGKLLHGRSSICPLGRIPVGSYEFFQDLVSDFGQDFPSDLLPLHDEKLTVADLDHLVSHLIVASDLDDFLVKTGLKGTPLDMVIRKVALYADDDAAFRRDMNRAKVLSLVMDLTDNLSMIILKK